MSDNDHQREHNRARRRKKKKRAQLRASVNPPVQAQDKREITAPPKPETNKQSEDFVRIKEAAKRSSFTDYIVALFTVVLTVVAVFQYFTYEAQLTVMRNDERAWLKFGPKPNDARPETSAIFTSVGMPILVEAQMSNVGKTPALDIDARGFIEVVDADKGPKLEDVMNTNKPANFFISGGIFFPNDPALQGPMSRANEKGQDILETDDESKGLAAGRKYIAVYGILRYSDVFGIRRWTKFCSFHVSPEVINPRFNARACTAFNSVGED